MINRQILTNITYVHMPVYKSPVDNIYHDALHSQCSVLSRHLPCVGPGAAVSKWVCV